MTDEILARVHASAPRRFIGIGVMLGLGALMIYIAIVQPPAVLGWRVFLVVFGLAMLWLADRMRRATTQVIELTRGGLRSSDGTILARLAGIEGVEKGTFALKPSNGFTVRLHDKAPRAWQPGLWWRLGRRVGIGGVTPGSQTKVMADILAALLAEQRD